MQNLSAKYCYNVLNINPYGTSINRLERTLMQSKIKLTPHQIDAALFAFRSPYSKGAILADEVGLGKTIEAGIVISQYILERKNRILIIAPASLLRQWECELFDKFGLESIVLDRKTYNRLKRTGYPKPFSINKVILCSYQMCSIMKDEISVVGFDLVVVDEAHKLRNVHNSKSVTAQNVFYAINKYKKLLLTATPIQNSLMDLYGLSQFIDTDIFPDKKLFKNSYIKDFYINEEELDNRIHQFLHRTLRKQVNKYIKFTNRMPKTFSFKQLDEESYVYSAIHNLLVEADDNVYIIPPKQRHLLLLILGKLMGSSMHAIVYTLNKILDRLLRIKETGNLGSFDDDFIDNLEVDIDEEDVLLENEDSNTDLVYDEAELNREIELINDIITHAQSVKVESKYIALQEALLYAFQHLSELGAEDKVVIFTESRRTQEYLAESLRKDGYTGVLTYNGTNTDIESIKIFEEWSSNPNNKELLSRSKSINIKSAILDKFKQDGHILIATEAGAEGLNLQFCSLVINYDLPWNPQRVEQRIGRCHRFGQLFDVVVINFISADNVVEQRVYELLNNKFSLFNEVLGSSDIVLGSLDKGENLAQSIIDIYTSCRSVDEINEAFDLLQEKFRDDIDLSIKKTKMLLLDNFDEDIQQYFTDTMNEVNDGIGELEKVFWRLTKCILGDDAVFNDSNYSFVYKNNRYSFDKSGSSGIYYGLNTELGLTVLNKANEIKETFGSIVFDKSNYPNIISALDGLDNSHGYIIAEKVTIQAVDNEEYLIINAILDDGTRLDSEVCKKLFRLNTNELYCDAIPETQLVKALKADADISVNRLKELSLTQNGDVLQKEIERINKWADDKIQAIQLSVEELREERKRIQMESELASNFVEKCELEEKIMAISKKIKTAWLQLADSEEEIESERKAMINNLKKMNYGSVSTELVFLAEFKVI